MHENMKINAKGRVKRSYQPWERKTLQKDRRKTKKKKFDDEPCPNWREREKFEKLLKSEFEQVKLSF